MNTDLFINGEFKGAKERQAIINPSTGEVIAEASVASAEDTLEAIGAARRAFDSGPWKTITLKERKDFVLKIAQGILEEAGELARLETLNTGKPIKESTFMDIPSSANAFEYFARNLEKYLETEGLDIEQKAQCKLTREPLGVAVLIVPWNYPLLIASWKLAQALAAGNTAILKPSSLTPLTALKLAEIIRKAGLPKGVVNIVNAGGEEIGKTLCGGKRVDMVSFTGSNEVGRKILEYTREYPKKLIMELGGKSAGIVLKDADMELAVNGSLCSIFLNQGQMCTAMSRILIEEGVYDKFVDDFVAKVKRIKLGPGMDHETQMGPLISESQRKKALGYVQRAKQEGAKLLCGGKIPDEASLKSGFFFEPTVFADVHSSMSVFQEEIFGPIACLIKFSSLNEAIELANNSDYGLACSIWSGNESTAKALASEINAGTVWVNIYGMFYNEAPYGGFKQSGFGKELGREGFLEYTRLKNVLFDRTEGAKPLVNYWYGF